MTCLICDGPTASKPAKIAPFLVKYCELDSEDTQTRFCPQCDLAFSQRRLTEADVKKIYTNYRGEDYTRIRLEVEPSYERFLPGFASPLSSEYMYRIRDYCELLNVYPELGNLKSILDFGGDGNIPSRVFPGAIIATDDLNAGATYQESLKYEMIFASNVFEHLSDPVGVLKELTQRLHPEGFIFIDVPPPFHSSLANGLLWEERHGGELYEMHEHINFFSKRSLNLLVRSAGLVPLFEYAAHYTALSVLAAFENSAVANRLLSEKPMRTVHFEARAARLQACENREALNAIEASLKSVIEASLKSAIEASSKNSQASSRNEPLEVYGGAPRGIAASIRSFFSMAARSIGRRIQGVH
ncbi:MAG: class I SAM-dependent methyltransferase [Pseudomonadota bacterium]